MRVAALLMTVTHGTAVVLRTIQRLSSHMIANYLFASTAAADDIRLLWKTYIHFHEIFGVGRETFYHSRFSLKTIKATLSEREKGEARMGK